MKPIWQKMAGLILLFLFSLSCSQVIWANDDTQAVSLDDMLSQDNYQDQSGENVSVKNAEEKIFAPLYIKNKVWLVPDPECLDELEQGFKSKSGILQIYSQTGSANQIEQTIEKFMSEKKPEAPVLIMVKKARAMQSDDARINDSQQRNSLKNAIIERIKRETGISINNFNDAGTPYGTRVIDVTSAAKIAKWYDDQIIEKSPIFLVPYQYNEKGMDPSQGKSADSVILEKYSRAHLKRLADVKDNSDASSKLSSLFTSEMKCDQELMVKVGSLFTAPAGTEVIVVGAANELGGVGEEEFARLAIYFRACRVWGSEPKKTVEALKQYIDGTLTPQGNVAQANVSEPNIFSEPVTGTVEVNTRLNMRSEPWGTIVGKLLPGAQIKIVGRQNDWYIAEINGSRVFVHQNYVSIPGKPASRVTPTPPAGSNTSAASDATDNSGSNNGGPPATLPAGTLNAGTYGFDAKRYGPLYEILEKYSKINIKYSNKGDSDRRYHGPDHWTQITDCSGLVGHVIDKLADASGLPSPINRSWYPDSQYYRTNKTTKITSGRPPTNPRDLIKPGDMFVMRREGGKAGHIGFFMGYTPSGQPIIAHSAGGTIKQSNVITGNVGRTGIRIEVMPSYYFTDSRWDGIFRLNAMDKMLNKLSS